ncbi:unnamed protein product, partial [Mesorhabditis spiculigera]
MVPIYQVVANLFALVILYELYTIASVLYAVWKSSWIFPKGIDDQGTIFFSSLFMVLWYQSSFSQILMAVNRLCVMCFSRWTIFTRRSTTVITLGIYPVALILAALSQYILPCCRIVLQECQMAHLKV